ncbi:ABC transporter permease [Kribbella kalugense]|uniref:ABC transporter permease n=1 Tax=Kribbella kalugense TaxID=2512221 RepID=UPI00141708BB|nr:ABC transporter permease [Kribbella kalugense]
MRRPSSGCTVLQSILHQRYAGFWVLTAEVIVFGLVSPHTFLTGLTLRTILSDGAVTSLLALGIMFPLLTGIFDLSMAWVAGFAMVMASYLSASHGLGTGAICVLTLGGSTVFGMISALLVSKLRVNSMVTTLGVGTIALGLTGLIANGNTITPSFTSGFTEFGRGDLFGVPLAFIYAVFIAAAMYYVLEHTALGRWLQATGGNPVAARLAGIRVVRLQVGVLIVSAFMSGFAGLVLATGIGVATESTAPAFLLPGIAAVFLGATQIKERANPWGTMLGVVLLGTGIKGLQLLGAAPWVSDFFNGAVLLIAVAISGKGIDRLH